MEQILKKLDLIESRLDKIEDKVHTLEKITTNQITKKNIIKLNLWMMKNLKN